MAGYITRGHPHFKRMLIFLCLMTSLTQAGLMLYTPAFVQMSQVFQVSPALIKMTLTAYLFGFAVSQLFYGPLSDRWGRKKILLIATGIFVLGCGISVYVTDYKEFLYSRCIQGIGVGAYLTLSRAILRDSFEGTDYFYAASFLSTGFALSLGLSPWVGGHLLMYFSWRAEFVFLLGFGIVLLCVFGAFLPETLVRSQTPKSMGYVWKKACLDYVSILKNRVFMSYLFCGVMAYGVVLAYTTMTPFLFQRTFGLSPSDYGWATLCIAFAYFASTSTNRALLHRYTPNVMIQLGIGLIVVAALMLFGVIAIFTTRPLIGIMICLMMATYGQAFVFSNTIALALKEMSEKAGTAAAFFSCLQMGLCSGISALMALPHETRATPIAWAILMLGLLSWSMLLLPRSR